MAQLQLYSELIIDLVFIYFLINPKCRVAQVVELNCNVGPYEAILSHLGSVHIFLYVNVFVISGDMNIFRVEGFKTFLTIITIISK